MKLNISKGKLSLANLLMTMLFAKLLSIAGFYWMHDLGLSANLHSLVSRTVEILIFLWLVSSLEWPQALSIQSLIFPRMVDKNPKIEILAKVIIVIVVAIISRYAIEILAIVLSDIFGSDELAKMRNMMPTEINGWRQFYNDLKSGTVAAQATISPVVEELIYRGVLLRYLMIRYSSTKALIISSLIFAAFHANPMGALLGGLGFGLLYFFTGNLLYSILAHSISNLTIVGLYSFSRHTFGFAFVSNSWQVEMWVFGVALGWLLFLGCLMYRHANVKTIRVIGNFPSAKGL